MQGARLSVRWRIFCLAFALVAACVTERPASQPVFAAVPRGPSLRFQYELADGKGWLGATSLRGRPSVIVFLATYDLASQAQARFLNGVFRRRGGAIGALAIALEPSENRPLILAFRDALGLAYPVAIGDAALIGGGGPFGDVRSVPSTVVLDSEARLVWKKTGMANEEEIEKALQGM